MKHKFLFFLLFSLFLTACGTANDEDNSGGSQDSELTKNGKAVVNTHGMIENLESLDQFLESFQNKEKADVRIIHYTIEGDPILTDLAYDGNVINVTYDSTRDEFGSGEVTKKQCTSISKIESNIETIYELDCNGKKDEILYIEYDVEKQDYFAFELKYGPNLQNVINTKEQSVTVQLEDNEMATISDFQFTVPELNKIYKSFVLANYLKETELSTSCDKDGTNTYELTVWINQGEMHHKWSSCDTSEEGKKMTKMAEKVLQVLQENKTFDVMIKKG